MGRPVSLGRYAGREGGDRPLPGGEAVWNTDFRREGCDFGRGTCRSSGSARQREEGQWARVPLAPDVRH